MPIALVTGPANAGKAEVAMDAVRRHVAHGAEPLLVVPTAADQARYRRELAEGGVGLGVRVERFQGLLDEVLARAGRAEALLGPLAREQLIASLAAAQFGADAAARAGLLGALGELIAEMQVRRVSPARLSQALGQWSGVAGEEGGVAAAGRLGELFGAYRDALARLGRADAELRAVRALDELRRSPYLWGGAPVVLYGFDDLTELQLDTIETLGAVVDAPLTVTLPYEPGRAAFAGRAEAFHRLLPLAVSHTALPSRAEHYAAGSRAALHHLERSLLEETPARVEPGGAVRLLEGSAPRAEFELVAGEVRALLDAGVPGDEIAIVHRSVETEAALLGEVLDDFAVPHTLSPPVRFADTALGRALLGAMRCACGEEASLGDLLAWLRAPGVLEHAELADLLEAAALRQSVAGARRAREMWEAERWPLERIDRLRSAAGQGPRRLIDALARELDALFSAPRRRAAAVLDEQEAREAQALVAAKRALEELRELARAAPELAPSPQRLAEALERLELRGGSGVDGSTVRPGLRAFEGEGGSALRAPLSPVAVVSPLALRARRVRALFLCGMQEHTFPAPSRPRPLLGEEERRGLAHASGLVLAAPADPLLAERYLLYAVCSRPEELLVLSWHTADEDGAPVAPSLFLDDVCDLFTADLRETERRRGAGAAGWPGPGLPAGQMAARAQAAGKAARRPEAPLQPLGDERVLASLREQALWSASSIEAWAACPVRWFVERLLAAKQMAPDSDPMVRGGAAHAVLRETLERLREQTGTARVTSASLVTAKRLLAQAIEQECERTALSSLPERIPGVRRRLQADLERYLEWASEGERMLDPAYFELPFGEPAGSSRSKGVDASGEVSAADGGGREQGLPALELAPDLKIRGRIDRVDLHGAPGAEQAVVYDYKTRSAPPAAKWAGEGSLQVALYMRAVQRLLGHEVAGGFYQPLSGKDLRARGAVDEGSALELDTVRTDRLSKEELEELLADCEALAVEAVAQTRAGALSPRPVTCSPGGSCAYPTICRCER